MTALTIPTLPARGTIEERAEEYAARIAELSAFKKELWLWERDLRERIRDCGPFRLLDGSLLGIKREGNNWDTEKVSEVMPALVSRLKVTFAGEPEKIIRAISLVEEEFSEGVEQTALETEIDVTAASRVLKEDGPAAEKLRACRAPGGSRLEVRSR